MRAIRFSLFILGLLVSAAAYAQPSWDAGFPRLRPEVRSVGLGVNLDQASTVYYVVYNASGTAGNTDPGAAAFTAAQIKAGTTPPGGTNRVAFGSFNFGDNSYCRVGPPGCSSAAEVAITRFFSVFGLPGTNLTYRVYFTAESIAAPGPLTAATSVTTTIYSTNRCLKVGSASNPPDAGKNFGFITTRCSPATVSLEVFYTGVDFINASPQTLVNFGDVGTTATAYAMTLQNSPHPFNLTEMNKEFRRYKVDLTNDYNYTAGDNPANNPNGSACTFRITIGLTSNGTNVCTGTEQTDAATIWDDPGTVRGIQDVNPNGPNAATEDYEVCERDRTAVNLFDASIFNCTDNEEARATGGLPNSPNYEARWVQWVYGVAGTNVTTGGGPNQQVTINGINFNLADFPIYGPIEYRPAVPGGPMDANSTAYPIRMPTTATTGQIFVLQMRSWNTCRTYDDNLGDANGLNPAGGTFDVGPASGAKWFTAAGTMPGADFPNAMESPIVFTKNILIIDTPDPPVVPDRDICSGDPTTLSVTGALGAGFTYRWYSNATLTTQLATGSTFTPSAAQAPVGQRTHFWVTVESTATGTCKSEATEVRLIRRPSLTAPAVTGPTNLCPSSNYNFTVTTPPANVTVTDATPDPDVTLNTEYTWTVPAGWTINSGDGTETINVTTGTTVANGLTVRAVRRYTTTPNCNSANSDKTVNVRARPTASILPNPAAVCEGGTLQMNGNPSALAVGSYTTHTWGGATAALDATNVQQPNVVTTVPGTFNVTYIATATFEAGVTCSSVAVNRDIVISASPSPATVGANQSHCGTLTSTSLGGSNPGVGTGTWTRVGGSGAGTISFSPNANDRNATATSTAVGIYILRWTVVNGTCTSFAEIQVDFGANPGTPDAGIARDFCGLTGSLNAADVTDPPLGTTAAWSQVAGPGTTTITNGNTDHPTFVVTVTGAYTYRYTISSGTCTPQTDDVVVTFFPPATVQNVADFTTCVDGGVLAAIPLSGTFGGGATQARWERVTGTGLMGNGTAVGAFDNSSPASDTYTPSAADFAQPSPATVQMRLITEDPAGPCTAVNDLVIIRFDKLPAAADGGSSFSVCGSTAALSAVAATNGGTGTWTGPVGVTFTPNANAPNATANNLAVGANNLTWTVTSAFGTCSSTNELIVVTRNTPPANNTPSIAKCVDVPGGSTAVFTLADLQALNDAITGIAGSTNRTVQFFTDALRTVPYPASSALTHNTTIYTTVTRTDVNPQCTTNGQFTVTVNARPVVVPQTPEFCEDAVGSNTHAGIDLTTFNNAVRNNVNTNTVAWFTDAARTIGVLTPTNVTAINGTIFYARVTNPTTTCTDDTQITITINPKPVANALIGPTNVCADPSSAIVYQLTTNNAPAGYTFSWSVPGVFNQMLGGGVNDYLVLLNFPSVVSPGQDISVTETSNKGCVGLPNVKNITVETSPPAIVISSASGTGPVNGGTGLQEGPFAVCENQSGVVFQVPTLANTTYAWTVPAGASIISGQGTSTVTVNFGIVPGTIAVTPTTTTGCAGSPANGAVAVNPRPSLDLLTNTVCSDSPAGITLSGTGAVSYNIVNVAVPAGITPASRPLGNGLAANAIAADVFTNTTGGSLIVQYSIVPVSGLGCTGDTRVVNLTIQPEPVLDPALVDEICSSSENVSIVLKVATGSFPADQYEITSVNPNGLTPLAGTPLATGIFSSTVLTDDRWQNLTAAPVTVEYFVRPRNSSSGCVGDPAVPVRVIVNPEPQVAPASQTICSGDIPSITFTTSPLIAGSTFAWTVKSTTGSITGQTSGTGPNITNVLVNNAATAGSVTYEVRATGSAAAGGCLGPATDVTITVNPAPLTNNVDQIVCSTSPGGTTFTENLIALQPSINSDGSLTFTWHTTQADALAGTNAMTVGTASAFPLANGVPVFVRVNNGICARVQAVTYTVNPSPSVTAAITSNYNGAQLSCNTSSNGIITVTPPTNGTAPYLYSIDGGSSFFTSVTFNGLSAAGNPYVIRVRDARGCTADSPPMNFVAPAALTATAAITSNFNGRNIRCAGDNNGQITVTPTGGTGAKTFSILELPGNVTGAATGVFTGLTAGSYTFVVKDVNNCQFTTATVTLVDPPAIVATAVLTTPVSCNGLSDGVITVTATGGTLTGPNYSYTISPGGTTNTTGVFSGLAANTYVVNVTDNNTCTRTSNSIAVTEPSTLTAFASVTSNYNGAKISCPGANDAVITVTANGGNGGYSYVLVQSPGNTTGNASGVYTGVGPGTYTVSVTDSKTCNVVTVPVNITEPTIVDATAVISNAISCNGVSDGEIRVSGTGGTGAYTFTMISPAGPSNATGIFSGLGQGSYDFQVRDLNNCSDVVTIVLNQPAVVAASAVVNTPYNGAQISCNGASDGRITVTATGGTGAFTYVFDQFPANLTGSSTGIFTGVPPGAGYTFTVRDVKNCSVVTVPVNVVQPTAITASAAITSNYNGQHISCPTSTDGQITVTASGGTGTLTYRLDQAPLNTSGNATGIYTGVGAGSYTVTVRDANNCFVVTAQVTVVPPPSVTASAAVLTPYNGRQISCNGASDGQITVTAGGGVAPYTFVLNEIPANVTGATTGLFTGLPAGTYTFNVRDANNCPVATTPVTISEPNALAASGAVISNYNGQQISCVGASDGSIRVTASGGTAPYTFISVEVPANVSGATTGIFTGLPAGSYTFTVRDVNNCNLVTTAVVISPPTALSASALVTSNYSGSQISCNGVNDGIIKVTGVGGTGVLHYEFIEDLSNTTGATSGTFIGIAAGGPYTFRVTDVNNCSVITTGVSITAPPPITASAAITSNYNGQHISCPTSTDGQITVTAAGGTGVYTYKLDQAPLNTSGNATGVYTGVGIGTYTVTVRDQNSCFVVTASVTITPPPAVTASAVVSSPYNGRQISCNGASDGIITVTAGGGVAPYSFVFDQMPLNVTGATTGVFTGVPAGTYTFTVRDLNNCPVTTTSVTVTQPAVLGATAAVTSNYNGQQITCNGASDGVITITVAGGTGPYAYTSVEFPANTTGATSGIFTGLAAGNYNFNVTDVNSCATSTLQVTVNQPAQIAANLTVTSTYNGREVSCNGASDGELTVVVTTPGTGTMTYTIDQLPLNASGRFSGVFTGVPAGNYTVTVRDVNNCSIVTNMETIDATPAIVASTAVTKNVSCFGESNGIITVTASGGTGALQYLLIEDASNLTGAASGVFTGLRAGNYRVRVTDINTCFVTTVSVAVTQPATLAITIAKMSPYNGFDLSCAGASDGEVRVTATTGGTGPYTYVLDGFPGNTTGATTGIFTGLSAGLYTITVTDNNSADPFGPCSKQSLPVFIQDPLPMFEGIVGFDKRICIGDDPAIFNEIAVDLTKPQGFGGIGNYTFQWQDSIVGGVFTNIAGANSATFDPPAVTQTTYYRRFVTSGTCASLKSNVVSVTVNPLPEIDNVTFDPYICENQAMIVTYDFAPGQAPFYFSYTKETLDQGGAVIATSVVVNEISGDSKPVIQSPFTDDVRITVNGLKDFNGCVANPALFPAPVFVEVLKTKADFNVISPSPQCSGSPFTLEWQADPEVQYTFTWPEGAPEVRGDGLSGTNTATRNLTSQNPSNTQSLPVIMSAENTRYLTDPTVPQCGIATALKNISIFPAIIPNIVLPVDEVCSGTPVTITNSTQGGTVHSWTVTRVSDGAIMPAPLTRTGPLNSTEVFVIDNQTLNNPEQYEIFYEIQNSPANGSCTGDATVIVTVYREGVAKIGAPKDPLTPIPVWTVAPQNITFENASVPLDGDFRYTWIFSNNNINTPPETFVDPSPTISYPFQNPGAGKRATLTVVNIAAEAAGLPNGCATRDEFVFEITIPPLVAAFDQPADACVPGVFTLVNQSTGGEVIYHWRVENMDGGEVFEFVERNPELNLNKAGRWKISLEIWDPNFPSDIKTAPDRIVNVYGTPTAIFTTVPFPNVFVGEPVRAVNTSVTGSDFSGGTGAVPSPIRYEWYFENLVGDGPPDIVTGINPDPTDPLSNHSPQHIFKIEQGSGNPITLVAINDHGNGVVCTDEHQVVVFPRTAGTSKIPNAFTPNPGGPNGGIPNDGDGSQNDVFLPITKGVKEFQMQIFDRWGNLIFESRQQTRGWDGYDRNGNLVPAGVYVYKLVLRMANDQRTTQVGDVTLIR
jgi:gliding motility-associated-like protein